jgi:threonine/homoserine/homoserine lactone efflux protein
MTGVHDITLFIVAGLLLNLTPGPDMAYIAARGASGGFRDGAAAVSGITAGCFVHTLAAALGLSALLATSATAFEIVKWCGALYLFYAGVRLILSGGSNESTALAAPGQDAPAQRSAVGPSANPAAALRIFREALMINVFNPKVALFFLAFVPQFIAADAPAKALAFVLLGALFNFNSLFVNLAVAWLASRAGTRLRGRGPASRWMQRATGALFIVLAGRLAALARD